MCLLFPSEGSSAAEATGLGSEASKKCDAGAPEQYRTMTFHLLKGKKLPKPTWTCVKSNCPFVE